jgi:hypothetical protein
VYKFLTSSIILPFVSLTNESVRKSQATSHIVPVNGIASNHPLLPGSDQVYYPDDVLQFSSNAGRTDASLPATTPNPPVASYLFQYSFAQFPMTRVQANSPSGPPFALALHTGIETQNAAVAITGVADRDHETVPVRLATNLNDENPAIANKSNIQPTAQPLTLTATVYGLSTGVKYNVYQYNSLAAIPNFAFNANASAAHQTFTFVATGSTYVLPQINILSNEVAAFRAVPASAH